MPACTHAEAAAARADEQKVAGQLAGLAGQLYICPVGELEQLYSARSARHYDQLQAELHAAFETVAAPPDILDRALQLQRDLAHQLGHVPGPEAFVGDDNAGRVGVNSTRYLVAPVRLGLSRPAKRGECCESS